MSKARFGVPPGVPIKASQFSPRAQPNSRGAPGQDLLDGRSQQADIVRNDFRNLRCGLNSRRGWSGACVRRHVTRDGRSIALKLLREDGVSSDTRSRFKNEVSFLSKNRHPNIVEVIDHGVARGEGPNGPFYVMPRYRSSLRAQMAVPIDPAKVLPLFLQILEGVEAAHLQDVIHRDLKPENVLIAEGSGVLAIADFGIARFNEEFLATAVKTRVAQRLANFQYAAPEQRVPGRPVGITADIYALALMLNEMFTGHIPQGTGFAQISGIAPEYAYLDGIVAQGLSQDPAGRPQSILEIKRLIENHRLQAISRQKVSALTGTVVSSKEVDDSSALEPPRLVGADWDGRELKLTLDRKVSQDWIQTFKIGSGLSYLMNNPPSRFEFYGREVVSRVEEHSVQTVIDHFKNWLPLVTRALKRNLEDQAKAQEALRLKELREAVEKEKRRQNVLKNIRI